MKILSKRIIIGLVSLSATFFISSQIIPLVESQNTCANSISCLKDLSGKIEEDNRVGEYLGKEVTAPSEVLALKETKVLGESTEKEKRIEIDLTNQRLSAYEGGHQIYNFLVSTGKWFPTPTGEFEIWVKIRSQRMVGGSKALGTYYNLPNVPHVMFFYNNAIPKWRGFGIHGAYWHNNFGHPMSHGCINLRLEDAEKLYNWSIPITKGWNTYASEDNQGTKVIIYGETPKD